MNKFGLNFLILSLPAIVGLFPYSAANAALRVNNSSLIQNRIQANAAATAAAAAALSPLAPQTARTVTNSNGETVTVSDEQMNACNAIYPNGRFDWSVPTSGRRKGGPATCVALVELRAYPNTSEFALYGNTKKYTVLASTYLAAGDSMKCNIYEFPESNITASGWDFTYPANEPPTIEEVARVMAQENKANAGWKILGATIVGALGGNMIGTDEPGKESVLGMGKDKLEASAVGAAGAAALMTASTFSNNYKASGIILSTGVNAAAGAVVGNLMGTGDEVIKIGPCKVGNVEEKYCVYGSVETGEETTTFDTKARPVFYDCNEHVVWECNSKGRNDEFSECKKNSGLYLTKIKLSKANNAEECNSSSYKCCNKLDSLIKFHITEAQESGKANVKDNKTYSIKKAGGQDTGTFVYEIREASQSGSRKAAYIPITDPGIVKKIKLNPVGYTDWGKLKGVLQLDDTQKTAESPDNASSATLAMYDSDGKNIFGGKTVKDFSPAWQSFDDSDTIDFKNKARTKATLIGAGGGAALGALSGAAGAEAEIQERWFAEQREYEASLQNIVCETGERWLKSYNETFEMPEMKVQQ